MLLLRPQLPLRVQRLQRHRQRLPGLGRFDDVVDEVMEAVMTRGGRVAIVADGSLDDRDRIALKLRY